jgi:hypothetical protein
MNPMKKGPELKMPEIKVPDFILDIYYDLRERHLLPLVAILLVSIVALPILLSSSSSDSPEPEEAVATLSTIPSSKLIVAKATPGLRDYHHRLAGTPRDPFEQQYKTSEDEGSATESVPVTESSPSGAESPPASTESQPAETTSPEPSQTGQTDTPNEGNGEPPSNGQLKYYSFAIDVRVVPVSSGDGKAKAEPTTRRDLPELTMLPGRKEPALTFMSVSKDESKALMLVSDKVTGLFGDGVCVVGAEHCQLLALEPGIPETVVYGPQGHSFRIELLKIRLLSTDKLHKAPLSKSEEEEDKPKGSGG